MWLMALPLTAQIAYIYAIGEGPIEQSFYKRLLFLFKGGDLRGSFLWSPFSLFQ